MASEELPANDHRRLGQELNLFVFSDLVGPGLPLFTPRGTLIRELLNDYVWELRRAKGYQKVSIPHLTKADLYKTSGHWQKFSDELFKVTTREDKLYALKPMNCPHHTQIYNSLPRSYRDLPQRYCETTMVYRDEQSGELAGLSRVLAITQDDAHVFARMDQVESEFFAVWDIVDTFYGTFGFKDIKVRISRHDPSKFEKYLGTPEIWAEAESILTSIVKERGITDYVDGIGEAAMYGPKIDFMAKDSLGRTLQVATIQLDLNLPKNFDLTCVNEKNEKEGIAMIHCAIMGSIERFMVTLIEMTAGAFPLWLAPVQVLVLPISDAHHEYAKRIFDELRRMGIRTEINLDNDTLGKKIRGGKTQKIPYLIVIGDKEVASQTLTAEGRTEKFENLTISDLATKLQTEIKEKK